MANSRATPVWWRGWTAENDRRPLWLPVALGAGACLYFALPSEPAIALGWAALAAAGALALLAAWLWRARAVLALAGAAFYLVVSGAASPAVRAFLMLAVGLAAVMLDRPALSLRGLGLAAAAILLLRPEAITDPGFQMSYAAVAALLAAAESDAAPGRGTLARVRGVFVTSAMASLATLPFALFHFGRAAHYAVLSNLLTMPVVGLAVMPFAALSVVAMPFGLEAWPLAALLLLTLGGLWLMLWRNRKRWLGLLPMLAAVIVALTARGPDLLVGGDAATVVLRAADGRLYFVGAPKERFAGREWLRRDGDVRQVEDMPGIGKCDGLGCVVRTQAGLVVLSRRPDWLAEDCARAAILISAASAKCAGPRLVIDGGTRGARSGHCDTLHAGTEDRNRAGLARGKAVGKVSNLSWPTGEWAIQVT